MSRRGKRWKQKRKSQRTTVEQRIERKPRPNRAERVRWYHDEYLVSDIWYTIRNRVFKRDGWLCVACKSASEVVHHKSYHADVLDGRRDDLLVSLCHRCHGKIEFGDDGKKVGLAEANRRLDRLMAVAPEPDHWPLTPHPGEDYEQVGPAIFKHEKVKVPQQKKEPKPQKVNPPNSRKNKWKSLRRQRQAAHNIRREARDRVMNEYLSKTKQQPSTAELLHSRMRRMKVATSVQNTEATAPGFGVDEWRE